MFFGVDKMKKIMLTVSIVSFVLTAVFAVLTVCFGNSVAYSLAITFGTILYHFAMRLLVGLAVDGIKHNEFNYKAKWFSEKKFEKKLYKLLRVKKWKEKVPTFDPDTFDVGGKTLEQIVKATCQAEVVHEIIVVLSFLPILASLIFGELLVFIITSACAALFDSVFVILQRFNRPRLLRLLKRKNS